MSVVPKEGGPYSLFCTDCKTWTPNTANYEMQKEGCYASSHCCGHLSASEITDEEWQKQKLFKSLMKHLEDVYGITILK